MGIPRSTIKLVSESVARHGISGRVLVIAKQTVYATEGQARRWIKESGAQLADGIACRVHDERQGFIEDKSLFRLLGFEEVVNLDVSDYEGCEVIHDLNKPVSDTLERYKSYFDLVVDAGNTEHIFNVPQVLQNFADFVKVGGSVIHVLPSSNWTDHGFYMFSPTFFRDYYKARNWEILDHYFVSDDRGLIKPRAYFYGNDGFRGMGITLGGTATYHNYVCVRKTDVENCKPDVQQAYYQEAWEGHDPKRLTLIARLREAIRAALPRPVSLYIASVINPSVGYMLRPYKSL